MINNPFSKNPLKEDVQLSLEDKIEKDTKEEDRKEVKSEGPHAEILKEYGGLESNIPINSRYWQIRP